ncbi:hypothetical protein HCA62_12505 [Listeria booriae]|nr:hypothetical protein [Listeria booriae]
MVRFYYEVNDMRVFVLFEPGHYADESGIVWGVFSTREEAEKHMDRRSYKEIYEHTIDEYEIGEE